MSLNAGDSQSSPHFAWRLTCSRMFCTPSFGSSLSSFAIRSGKLPLCFDGLSWKSLLLGGVGFGFGPGDGLGSCAAAVPVTVAPMTAVTSANATKRGYSNLAQPTRTRVARFGRASPAFR